MKNYSNSRNGNNRNNNSNSRSYQYPQRHNREWDTLENSDNGGTSQTGGSYDRRNNYGGYTSDYQTSQGYENRPFDSYDRDSERYSSRSGSQGYSRGHNDDYRNEHIPGTNYSSRHDFGSRGNYSSDDRNFFERTGDRIRQKWNDWTDNDNDRPYNDYENRQSYRSNYNDRDGYNNSYDRYRSGRNYDASNSDRDLNNNYRSSESNRGNYYGSSNAGRGYNSNSGNSRDYSAYGPSGYDDTTNRGDRRHFDPDKHEHDYGYGTSTRSYNGNRGSYGSHIRSREDYSW